METEEPAMKRNILRALLALSVVGLMLGSIGPGVFAQDATPPAADQTAAPAQILLYGEGFSDGERYTVSAEPGDTKALKVFIGNGGTEDLPILSYTSNIRTKINGGLDMGLPAEEVTGTPTWVDYPTQQYDLPPQEVVSVSFNLSVPADTEPGEYVIPIAAETVEAYAVEGAGSLRQKIRKVITIYVTVGSGFSAGFEFGEPQITFLGNQPAIQVPITNTGQTTLRMMGQLTLKDSEGNAVVDAPIALGTFYRKDQTIVQFRLDSIPAPGDYSLTLQLTDTISNVSNGFENKTVAMPEAPSTEVVPLAFGNILIAPNADPIQFASAAVEIVNNADVIRSTRLTLIVTKDGKPLEEFVLADNVLLQQGTTTVSQRYLPLTGWESGTYTFGLKLESIDPSSGAVTQLLLSDKVAEIVVP